MKNSKLYILVVILFLINTVFSSCEKPFGDKTDIGFIEVPVYDNNVIAFVPIQPAFQGLQNPVDIVAGYDELIYVADQSAEKIIAYDKSGIVQGELAIKGIKSIAQDRSLELLALGTRDTIINSQKFTVDAIYRINLQGSAYGLRSARIKKIVLHPFYFKTSFTTADTAVHLNRLSIMADNSYYVTRSGPSNNPNQLGGPDDAVLLFNTQDKFISTLNVNTEQGLISDYFKKPFSISTLAKAPQSNSVKIGGDFLFTSIDVNTAIKTQYIRFESNENGASYSLNQSLNTNDSSKAEGFIYTPNRFINPKGITIAGDGTNYIFISDAKNDSIYLFTLSGLEGVDAPASSVSRKNINVSFGGTGAGPTQFNKPGSMAYIDKILYVCDSRNGRISRFKLTTDFQ